MDENLRAVISPVRCPFQYDEEQVEQTLGVDPTWSRCLIGTRSVKRSNRRLLGLPRISRSPLAVGTWSPNESIFKGLPHSLSSEAVDALDSQQPSTT